jgi:hypothetical protein
MEYKTIKDNYLDTIGNLTLSGNNGALGNKSFIEKRNMNTDGKEQGYRFSRLWLNRDLKELDSWGIKQIEDRSERIAQRFLEVWPIPVIDLIETDDEVNIFDADEPKNKRLEYATFFGNRISENQITKLYIEIFKQLLVRYPQAFYGTELGKQIQLSMDKKTLRQPVLVADNYFIESNMDSNTKFQRIKQILTELDLENELFIKYAA